MDHLFKLDAALVRAGLIELKIQRETLSASNVASWKAAAWVAGGSAAIVLRDPDDPALRSKVRQALDALAANPDNGIARILDGSEIAQMGGTPRAAFWLDLRPGYAFSPTLEGPLATAVSTRGTHGYAPDHPEMYSSFFLQGAGIRRGANLGTIDMRAIAPTLASVMGVPFTSADQPPLPVLATPNAAGKTR